MINETQQIEKLTELNDDLENYFRNTIIPQLYVDGNLILRKFTPPAMKQFNLSTGDIGKSIIDIIDNFRLPTIIENIHQVITSNEIFEKELQTTDLRWYQMNLIPYIIKKKNQTDGVIMTFVEITMRIKDLEEQEKLIAEHENLLHTISHDIRSPVGNLMLTMDLFKNNLFEDQKQHFSLIETAKKSLMKMRNVIDELTEDLRKQKDKHASEQELSDFQGVLEDVKLSISHHIADLGAVIRSKIGVQKLAIPRSKLRSLIYNLLSNAIKYRSPERTLEIMVNVTKEKEFDVISVKDNRMGIDTIKQKNIFEKYFQVQDYIKGSGIGLYLVKQIVNQFGGKILLDSHLGEGSEFKLYLKAL